MKNYKNISIKQIMLLVEMIKPLFEGSHEKEKKRGRPRKYSEEFILALFFIKILRGYSFRTLRVEAGDLFSKDIPSISTIHYRISKLDPDKLKKAVSLLVRFIDNKLGNAEKEYVFADGTGFGFDDKIPLSYCRGKEIREVSGHVKTEILAASSPAGDKVRNRESNPVQLLLPHLPPFPSVFLPSQRYQTPLCPPQLRIKYTCCHPSNPFFRTGSQEG